MSARRSPPKTTRLIILLVAIALRRPSSLRAEEVLPTVTVVGEAPPAGSPPAVTVVPDETIQAMGADNVRDLVVIAPNFVVQQGGDRKSPFLGVRGLTNTTMGDSSVGLYVDGIPYADIRGAFLDLYDFDHVEVFRGPQTTIFGRNAESGALNLRTVRPGNRLSARGAIRFGAFDEQVHQAAISGPLVHDRVFLGVSAIKSSRDGFIRNTFLHDDLDSRDLAGGRGQLVVLPLPGLEVALVGEGAHADDGGKAFVRIDSPDPFEARRDTVGSSKLDTTVGALRLRYELPAIVVTALTARRFFDSYDNDDDLDLTAAPIGIIHDDHRFLDWTQELRIESPRADDRWRWRIGGFFEDTTTEPRLAADLVAERPALTDIQEARLEARTWAGFVQTSRQLLPGLDATAGLRVEYFRVQMRRDHFAGPLASPPPTAPTIRASQDGVAWLPHARLAWAPHARLRVYASAARGYRPGGFSFFVDDPVAARFRPSFGWTYELGARASWLDGRLGTGLTLYWARVRDYQNFERVDLTSFVVQNAERVTSRGIEAEVTASPIRGLEVILEGGIIDAEYDRFCDQGRCFDGNTVALAPDYDFAATLAYRHPSGFVAEATCRGVGSYPFLADNTRSQGAYQLVSVRFGWEWKWFGLYAYGRNLADQIYFPFVVQGDAPNYITTPGDPRTAGVMLVARY